MKFIALAICLGVPAWAQVPAPAAAPAAPTVEQLQERLRDWAQLVRYRDENGKLAPPAAGERRVVFMGDSITDFWGRRNDAKFFPDKPYVNRGISGQITAQMLVRFRQDVIALSPQAVVILAGTNDLARDAEPGALQRIEDNLQSMMELAKTNGIRVVLASVTPVCDCSRNQTARRPLSRIVALNAWIRDYAAKNGLVYLDYYSAMLDDQQLLRKELTYDGLHPNDAGYAVMAPLAEKAIARALGTN